MLSSELAGYHQRDFCSGLESWVVQALISVIGHLREVQMEDAPCSSSVTGWPKQVSWTLVPISCGKVLTDGFLWTSAMLTSLKIPIFLFWLVWIKRKMKTKCNPLYRYKHYFRAGSTKKTEIAHFSGGVVFVCFCTSIQQKKFVERYCQKYFKHF